MHVSRRSTITQLGLGLTGLLAPPALAQETTSYQYDVHGRLVKVTFNNNTVVLYGYDDAGNRTRLIRSPSGFVGALAVSSNSLTLRQIADNAGFNGAQDAIVAFRVSNSITGVPGNGTAGGAAIDTGVWPTATHSITLTLIVPTGVVLTGGGGAGGDGEGGSAWTPIAPGAGGHAINCQAPINILIESGASVRGGGGGGGGGVVAPTPPFGAGGGGGGGVPNGAGGRGGIGDGGQTGGAGNAASASTPGTGGNGNQGAPGMSGGGIAAAGVGGAAAGYAIRKNGNTVNVTNNGTISGAVG